MVAAATANAGRQHCDIRFIHADFNAGLPFPDASFDAAACILAFDHARRPAALAAELHRVLAPGAYVLLVTLTKARRPGRPARRRGVIRFARRLRKQLARRMSRASVRTYEIAELRGLFGMAGFDILDERTEVSGQVDLILRKR